MAFDCKQELEQLLSGKKDSVEWNKTEDISREEILEEVNTLIMKFFPGSWTKGKFVNEEKDYLVYDIELNGIDITETSIRFLDFGDKFLLLKV